MTENHLYILDANSLRDDSVYGYWYEKMPTERRDKIDRFRFEKDKRLSLGAGILMHIALGRAGVKNISVNYGEHGKPYIADNEDVYFNISHSGKAVVCAVSPRPVGVDVEEERHFDDRLKAYVLHPDELGSDPTDAYCTRLWTIKESVMKYFGTGISLGAKNIHINMDDGIGISCNGYNTSGLFITECSHDNAAISVCSEFAWFAVAPEHIDPAIER